MMKIPPKISFPLEDFCKNVIQIDTGKFFHHCAIAGGGALKCWESSYSNEKTWANLPTSTIDLGTGMTAKQVAVGSQHKCVILNDDTLRCWGEGDNGRLGIGSSTDQSTPQTVNLGTGMTAKQVALGQLFTCAILNDDTVKCWGSGYYGQLGQTDKNDKNTPQTVSNYKAKQIILIQQLLLSWSQESLILREIISFKI